MELYGVARSWMNDEYIYSRNSSWMVGVGLRNVWATLLGVAAQARGNLGNRLLGAKLLGTNVIRIDVLQVEAGIINTNYILTELEVAFRHGIISKCMLH